MDQQKRAQRMEDESFLESLVGKTHLTPTDKRNLVGLKAYRAVQQLIGHRFEFNPDDEYKHNDGKASPGKALVSKSTKPKAKKGNQKKNTKSRKTDIPLTQRTLSDDDIETSDEDSDD